MTFTEQSGWSTRESACFRRLSREKHLPPNINKQHEDKQTLYGTLVADANCKEIIGSNVSPTFCVCFPSNSSIQSILNISKPSLLPSNKTQKNRTPGAPSATAPRFWLCFCHRHPGQFLPSSSNIAERRNTLKTDTLRNTKTACVGKKTAKAPWNHF